MSQEGSSHLLAISQIPQNPYLVLDGAVLMGLSGTRPFLKGQGSDSVDGCNGGEEAELRP